MVSQNVPTKKEHHPHGCSSEPYANNERSCPIVGYGYDIRVLIRLSLFSQRKERESRVTETTTSHKAIFYKIIEYDFYAFEDAVKVSQSRVTLHVDGGKDPSGMRSE